MRLAGLGIDLQSLARAEIFLKQHERKTVDRLLTAREKNRWRRVPMSPVLFSKIFTAKEAFFKALGRPWMGLDGFRNIEVTFLARDKFCVRTLERGGRSVRTGSGAFMRTPELTGAQVMIWEKCPGEGAASFKPGGK